MKNNIGRPYSFQIEFVEGCTKLCPFCGLGGIRSGPGGFKFMSEETLVLLCEQMPGFCSESRVEFAMHGEPTAHPKHLEFISRLRAVLPKTNFMLCTNGVRFLGDKDFDKVAGSLFDAGVDLLMLDTYYPERDLLRRKAFGSKMFRVVDFYDQGEGDITPYRNYKRKLNRVVVLMDDLGARSGENKSRVIYNHGGSNPSLPRLPEPLRKTCTMPFREMAVSWNGDVNLCCHDWKHEFVIDNIHKKHIREIWNSPRFEAARAHLQNKDRRMMPCKVCDIGSGARSGLLPKYPPPTEEQRKIVFGGMA